MPHQAKPANRVKPYRTPITAWRVTDLEGNIIPAQIIEDRRGRRYLQILDANGVWDGRSIPFCRACEHLIMGVRWRQLPKTKMRAKSFFFRHSVLLNSFVLAA